MLENDVVKYFVYKEVSILYKNYLNKKHVHEVETLTKQISDLKNEHKELKTIGRLLSNEAEEHKRTMESKTKLLNKLKDTLNNERKNETKLKTDLCKAKNRFDAKVRREQNVL